jgi:hypothetical protein
MNSQETFLILKPLRMLRASLESDINLLKEEYNIIKNLEGEIKKTAKKAKDNRRA